MILNHLEIKRTADIITFISQYVKLKKRGINHIGLCPFHNEKSGSFTVSPAKRMYKCFGCGKAGDIYDFYREYEKKSYVEAVEHVASFCNMEVEYDKEKVYDKPPPRLEKIDKRYIEWFEGRGISNNTTLRLNITQSKEWMPATEKIVPVICYNYYRGDELVNIKFRAKDKDFRLNKGSELIFYNLNSLIGEDTGIIVEGENDVLALHEAAIYNSISVPNGASKSGNNNLQYVDNCANDISLIRKWIIFTDNDLPGKTLAQELAFRLGKHKCSIVILPDDCKDANDVLIKFGKEKIHDLITNAVPCIRPDIKPGSFPMDIFHPDIADSFRALAAEHSVPVDYLGTTALFTISALSGAMYTTSITIQNIIFAMLVGPSGVGKSPAYNILCGDVVENMEQDLYSEYRRSMKEWEASKLNADKSQPRKPKPVRKIRTAKGGTMEGIMRHAETSPAGFGLYYDEGGKMLGGPNQFKKDNSSVDFWNELWNGKYFNELRADSELERFAAKNRISVMIGMQTDRVHQYFTRDATDSGLTYRFLFTQSDHITLNEFVDHFSDRRQPHRDWCEVVKFLFRRGLGYDGHPLPVEFNSDAATLYNEKSAELISASNELREARRIGDHDEMILTYQGKLYQYFGRFCLVLAILNNPGGPVITIECVEGAIKLYEFYHQQAEVLFKRLNRDQNTDLNTNERLMYDALPDREFNRDDIQRVSMELNMSDKFFDTAFRRKYKDGWIRRLSKGKYEKIT
jgi:5S rRNA maturation endonuclease (ribonuclease M5)